MHESFVFFYFSADLNFTDYLHFLPTLFVLCGVMPSVCSFTCSEVWTLGVWGDIELVCHIKDSFPTTPVLKAGHLVSSLCVCVCVFGG